VSSYRRAERNWRTPDSRHRDGIQCDLARLISLLHSLRVRRHLHGQNALDVLHVILHFRFFLLAAWEVSDFVQGELRGFDPLYWWSFCLFQQQPASRPVPELSILRKRGNHSHDFAQPKVTSPLRSEVPQLLKNFSPVAVERTRVLAGRPESSPIDADEKAGNQGPAKWPSGGTPEKLRYLPSCERGERSGALDTRISPE
jgi:hypothetical protein